MKRLISIFLALLCLCIIWALSVSAVETAPAETLPPAVEVVPPEDHYHEYTAKVVLPTHSSDGYTEYFCSCGDSYIDGAEKAGHCWDYGVVTKNPTETEAGNILHTCIECGETYDETVKPLGSLSARFEDVVGYFDYFYSDMNFMYYILRVASNQFCSYETTGFNPVGVHASIYEAVLHRFFEIDDAMLENIRNYSGYDLRYSEVYNTYTVTMPGGWGGLLCPRTYAGYVQNGDTYEVYYKTLTYELLSDVLPEGTTESDLFGDEWPNVFVYEGNAYVSGMDGYYRLISVEDYGKKYTVDINGNAIRILSKGSFDESTLPEAFDDNYTHKHNTIYYDYDESVHCEVCHDCDSTAVAAHEYIWVPSSTEANVYERKCLCGASLGNVTIEQDEPVNKTDSKENSADAVLSNTDAELLGNVLTKEEQDAVADGASISIRLDVDTFTSENIPTEDKAMIEATFEELAPESDAEMVYLDVNLYKDIAGAGETKIEETTSAVKITVSIPEELFSADMGRKYVVIRVHNGESTVIENCVYNAASKTLTFETDRFSTYALTYVDEEYESTPGDVNGDGVINTKDAVLLAQGLAGWGVVYDTSAADCNGDKAVNTKDAVRLAQKLAGWDVELVGPVQNGDIEIESDRLL